MGLKLDTSGLLKGLGEADIKMKAAVGVYCDAAGKKLEREAKANRPWTDRQPLARPTIKGGKEWQGSKCRVFVSGNTDYFEYLEFAHEKKYAVLWPAIQANSKKMLEGMHKILEK